MVGVPIYSRSCPLACGCVRSVGQSGVLAHYEWSLGVALRGVSIRAISRRGYNQWLDRSSSCRRLSSVCLSDPLPSFLSRPWPRRDCARVLRRKRPLLQLTSGGSMRASALITARSVNRVIRAYPSGRYTMSSRFGCAPQCHSGRTDLCTRSRRQATCQLDIRANGVCLLVRGSRGSRDGALWEPYFFGLRYIRKCFCPRDRPSTVLQFTIHAEHRADGFYPGSATRSLDIPSSPFPSSRWETGSIVEPWNAGFCAARSGRQPKSRFAKGRTKTEGGAIPPPWQVLRSRLGATVELPR